MVKLFPPMIDNISIQFYLLPRNTEMINIFIRSIISEIKIFGYKERFLFFSSQKLENIGFNFIAKQNKSRIIGTLKIFAEIGMKSSSIPESYQFLACLIFQVRFFFFLIIIIMMLRKKIKKISKIKLQ